MSAREFEHPTTHTSAPSLLDALARQHERLNAALEAIPPHMWRNQYHPDLSPIGWHYAHCHFIEAVWLRERVLGLDASGIHGWHDLYFPELSPKWRRGGRLPAGETLLAWGRDCQARHHEWLTTEPDIRHHALLEGGYLVGFLAQHHAMHLETLAQVRWFACLRGPEAGSSAPPRPPLHSTTTDAWMEWDATSTTVGTTDVLAFDNEQALHTVELAPFAIQRDPVTNAEWTAFIEDHGYSRNELWSDEGREWRDRLSIQAPLGWRCTPETGPLQVLPEGTVPRHPHAPVVGVSRYEAEAFARWARARLPHEHEWEHAQRNGALDNTGRIWEWCDNPFAPYPGFRPFPYNEYSLPWFDGRHYVLRGGSDWSDPLLKRPGMRNFYTPDKRHVFAGVRLARTMEP